MKIRKLTHRELNTIARLADRIESEAARHARNDRNEINSNAFNAYYHRRMNEEVSALGLRSVR